MKKLLAGLLYTLAACSVETPEEAELPLERAELGDILHRDKNSGGTDRNSEPTEPVDQSDDPNLGEGEEEPLPAVPIEYLQPSSIDLPAAGTYAQGSLLVFQVHFETPVVVDGNPYLNLQIGEAEVEALYIYGSGTTTLEFSYTPLEGDEDSDGVELLGLSNGTSKSTNEGIFLDEEDETFVASMASVLINTVSLPPGQVENVVIAPTVSFDQLAITWSVPENNGEAIVDYLIQSRVKGSLQWENRSASQNSLTISELAANTIYEFRIAASNGQLGPFSLIQEASTFNVNDLNPVAWLDATDILADGTSFVDGSSVSRWVDKSGNASDAEESEVSNQPVVQLSAQNGLPAVRFDDRDRGLQGSFTRTVGTDLTILIVGQFDSGYSDRCMFEFRGPSDARAFFIDRRYAGNSYYNPALTKDAFKLWTVTNKGGSAQVGEGTTTLFDDSITFNTDFIGEGNYVLGDDTTGGNRLHGFIGEVLIFDRELTAEELATLQSYLDNKWGL